jgi:hypothetical protein
MGVRGRRRGVRPKSVFSSFWGSVGVVNVLLGVLDTVIEWEAWATSAVREFRLGQQLKIVVDECFRAIGVVWHIWNITFGQLLVENSETYSPAYVMPKGGHCPKRGLKKVGGQLCAYLVNIG